MLGTMENVEAISESYNYGSIVTLSRRTFGSSGFSTEGTLISASAVPHCKGRENHEEKLEEMVK